MTLVIAGCGARTGLLDDEPAERDGGSEDGGRDAGEPDFDAAVEPLACTGVAFPRATSVSSIRAPLRSNGLGVAIPDPEGVLVTGGLLAPVAFSEQMAFIDFGTGLAGDVPVNGERLEPPLRDAVAVYRQGSDRVILIGGTNRDGATDAVFQLTGEGDPGGIRAVRARSLPRYRLGPVTGHVATFDPRADRVIVHGGMLGSGGTWALELDGAPEWSEIVSATDSPPASVVAMGYDPVLHRAIELSAVASGEVGVFALDLEPGAERWTRIGTMDFVPSLRGELVWDERACGFHILSARRTRCVLEHWILAIEGDAIRTVYRGDLDLSPAHFVGASVFSPRSRRIAVFASERCDAIGIPNDTAHLIELTP
jgi:hypothetical protein